jgi:hypothetical protein
MQCLPITLLLDLTAGSGFAISFMLLMFALYEYVDVFLVLEVNGHTYRKSLQQYLKVVPILHTLNIKIYYECCCCCCYYYYYCVIIMCLFMFLKCI